MCLGVVLDHNGEEDNEDDTDDKQRAYKSVFVELATGVITMKKYIIKKKYVFINVCLIVVGFFCMVSRWLNSINPEIKLLPDFLLSHISDFSICMMALLILGFVAICFGARLNIVTIAALLITVFGIVYECFIPFLNTPDIWDAIFVVIGTAVAYFYLVMLKKNGLIEQ